MRNLRVFCTLLILCWAIGVAGLMSSVQAADIAGLVLRIKNTATTVRGTDFWGGSLDGVYNVALLSGKAVIIENAAGRVEITQPGFGATVTGANVAPTAPTQWAPEKQQRAVDSVAF